MIDKTIIMHNIPVTDFTLQLPSGFEFLRVGESPGGGLAMWFEVNPHATLTNVEFNVEPEGGRVEPRRKYLGSALSPPLFVYEVLR